VNPAPSKATSNRFDMMFSPQRDSSRHNTSVARTFSLPIFSASSD
jgi:hypothetical protein